MAEALILEFRFDDAKEMYEAVNRNLGIVTTDPADANWPAGLLSHGAGETDGSFVVIETWDSKASQERFMQERLGPALQAAGAMNAGPPNVRWIPLTASTVTAR